MMKIITINGRNCQTKQDLFKSFSEAFNFPDYFSFNWDSFDEVICDLSWVEEDAITLVINHYSDLLVDAKDEDKDVFFDILSHVEEYSGKLFTLELVED